MTLRIRYVRNEHNLGISANFNRCLELAGADADVAVVFHADDVLEPGYIATMRRRPSRLSDGDVCRTAGHGDRSPSEYPLERLPIR